MFDGFTKRDSSVHNTYTQISDAYNTTQNDTRVFDNLGNVNLTLANDGNPGWAKMLPLVAVGVVVLGVGAMLMSGRNR